MSIKVKGSFWLWLGVVLLVLDPVFDHVWAAWLTRFPYKYKDMGRLFFISGGVLFLTIGCILRIKQRRGLSKQEGNDGN